MSCCKLKLPEPELQYLDIERKLPCGMIVYEKMRHLIKKQKVSKKLIVSSL